MILHYLDLWFQCRNSAACRKLRAATIKLSILSLVLQANSRCIFTVLGQKLQLQKLKLQWIQYTKVERIKELMVSEVCVLADMQNSPFAKEIISNR